MLTVEQIHTAIPSVIRWGSSWGQFSASLTDAQRHALAEKIHDALFASTGRAFDQWWERYYPKMGLDGSSQFVTIHKTAMEAWNAAIAAAVDEARSGNAHDPSDRIAEAIHRLEVPC